MYKRGISELIRYLPSNISKIITNVHSDLVDDLEEIRLRIKCPLLVSGLDKDFFLNIEGKVVSDKNHAYIVTAEDLRNAVQLISNFSLYSVEEELRNGYITIKGGHRVGISGRAVMDNNKIKVIKDISFMNYRIAKQVIGAADKILNYIIDKTGNPYNTLIISPPQCGKTTMLRDIVRQLSNGISSRKSKPKKIALVDERNEIAACYCGIPRNDIGIRTDVLDSSPKAEGIILMIRSMSPELIVTDEIGRREDGEAILDAINAGVKVITSIHGGDIEDFLIKNSLESLRKDMFERIVVLSRNNGVGTIEKIYDENYKEIRLLPYQ